MEWERGTQFKIVRLDLITGEETTEDYMSVLETVGSYKASRLQYGYTVSTVYSEYKPVKI